MHDHSALPVEGGGGGRGYCDDFTRNTLALNQSLLIKRHKTLVTFSHIVIPKLWRNKRILDITKRLRNVERLEENMIKGLSTSASMK